MQAAGALSHASSLRVEQTAQQRAPPCKPPRCWLDTSMPHHRHHAWRREAALSIYCPATIHALSGGPRGAALCILLHACMHACMQPSMWASQPPAGPSRRQSTQQGHLRPCSWQSYSAGGTPARADVSERLECDDAGSCWCMWGHAAVGPSHALHCTASHCIVTDWIIAPGRYQRPAHQQ